MKSENKNPLKDEHEKIGHTELRKTDIDIIGGARQTGQLDRLKSNANRDKVKTANSSYRKLAVMLVISFFVMYGMMFLNVDRGQDIYLSLTRLYMSLLMVSPMAILMLLMMPAMYPKRMINNLVIVMSSIVFLIALLFLRTQFPVNDRQYMKAMIPHHSSAILTSKNARIKDPRVRKLADSIIRSQRREIAEMKTILKSMDQ
jgi:hypothetical protein